MKTKYTIYNNTKNISLGYAIVKYNYYGEIDDISISSYLESYPNNQYWSIYNFVNITHELHIKYGLIGAIYNCENDSITISISAN